MNAYYKVSLIWSFDTFTDIILGKSKALWPCNRMKNCANQVALDEFWKWVRDDEKAMQDQNKRIVFGKEYCDPKDWKFVWKAFDKEVST